MQTRAGKQRLAWVDPIPSHIGPTSAHGGPCLITSVAFSISFSLFLKNSSLPKSLSRSPERESCAGDAVVELPLHSRRARRREQGCDASVLLDSTANVTAEKDGPPNASLHAIIDNAKAAMEALCPVVSCADILAPAVAARKAVTLSGGPSWLVPVGRRDGRVSLASETTALLHAGAQGQLRPAQAGLPLPGPLHHSTKDLIVLSGSHTLGFAHCSSFHDRILNNDPALRSP
jgi:hypothetical protein